MSEFGPPAEGRRVEWSDVPAIVRARVEETLGARVVKVETCRPGFSPGVAARITLATGEAVFLKLASDAHNPLAPTIHRREIEVLSSLPQSP